MYIVVQPSHKSFPLFLIFVPSSRSSRGTPFFPRITATLSFYVFFGILRISFRCTLVSQIRFTCLLHCIMTNVQTTLTVDLSFSSIADSTLKYLLIVSFHISSFLFCYASNSSQELDCIPCSLLFVVIENTLFLTILLSFFLLFPTLSLIQYNNTQDFLISGQLIFNLAHGLPSA